VASDSPPDSARPEPQRYAILIVDDEVAILESLELTFADDYDVFTARTGAEGLAILEREPIALMIVDQVMHPMSGAEFLERAVAIRPEAVRMMLTGYADFDAIVRAINDGRVYRYIQKPWEPEQLRLDVKRALEAYGLMSRNAELAAALLAANRKLQLDNVYLRRELERRYGFDQIIGASPAMQRVFELMEKVAQTDATVLLSGETGTGKDLVARAIHFAGSRASGRFVAQNCGALPDTLLESELFGHKRGAFTGAHADKKGLFELADGGTIFLDEIGETEPGMQVRLLRVLQDGEIRPLGSSETRRVDVRIIAATNRDLRRDVAEGRFREDLFYRLRVVEIALPPLRERREDIPALAHHFLDAANKKMGRSLRGFTNAAMERLIAHDWSGNIRELENEVQRAVVLAGDAETIGVDLLSSDVRPGEARSEAPGAATPGVASTTDVVAEIALREPDMNTAVDDLKRAMITRAIEETGSKSKAAERLGIPRQSLQKMMKRLGMAEGVEEA
jgi:two-component system response regulator HupR/HoxA